MAIKMAIRIEQFISISIIHAEEIDEIPI